MGKGTISVNQSAQYGDKKVLDSVKKSTQAAPISGAAVPVRTAGRPATGQSQPDAVIPPDHQDLFMRLAQADRAARLWQQVAATSPGKWSALYSQMAADRFTQIAQQVKDATPDFE